MNPKKITIKEMPRIPKKTIPRMPGKTIPIFSTVAKETMETVVIPRKSMFEETTQEIGTQTDPIEIIEIRRLYDEFEKRKKAELKEVLQLGDEIEDGERKRQMEAERKRQMESERKRQMEAERKIRQEEQENRLRKANENRELVDCEVRLSEEKKTKRRLQKEKREKTMEAKKEKAIEIKKEKAKLKKEGRKVNFKIPEVPMKFKVPGSPLLRVNRPYFVPGKDFSYLKRKSSDIIIISDDEDKTPYKKVNRTPILEKMEKTIEAAEKASTSKAVSSIDMDAFWDKKEKEYLKIPTDADADEKAEDDEDFSWMIDLRVDEWTDNALKNVDSEIIDESIRLEQDLKKKKKAEEDEKLKLKKKKDEERKKEDDRRRVADRKRQEHRDRDEFEDYKRWKRGKGHSSHSSHSSRSSHSKSR